MVDIRGAEHDWTVEEDQNDGSRVYVRGKVSPLFVLVFVSSEFEGDQLGFQTAHVFLSHKDIFNWGHRGWVQTPSTGVASSRLEKWH